MKRLFLTFLLALLTAAGASATPFIKEVMLLGSNDYEQWSNLRDNLENQGWIKINYNLNQGTAGGSDDIYLFYKGDNNTDGANWGYITGFYLTTDTSSDTITYDGRTYHLVPYEGGDHFKERKGDLNSHAGGDDIHMYYTRDLFPDNRAVTSITFNGTGSGAVGWNGDGSAADLNKGCGANTDYIYMHVYTATATCYQPDSHLDNCVGGDHTITVSGWAYDPDAPSRSIDVHVYVYQSDGTTVYKTQAFTTNIERTDLNSAKNITGNHGFSASVSIPDAGTYKVKVYAIDYNGYVNPQIGSTATVTVTGNQPVGALDTCLGGNGVITVAGWAYDPDAPSKSIDMHVYIYKADGTTLYLPKQTITADKPRSDVNSAHNITGNHGFSASFDIDDSGSYVVKVYAIDDTSDGNPQIGSTTTVTVIREESIITIGNGIRPNDFPLNTRYSLCSQIFLAEEIGMRGSISAIALCSDGAFTRQGVKVYMKHTDKNKFESASDFIALSESDKVFDGSISSEGGWFTITLSTSFEYNGSSNLLIGFYVTTKVEEPVSFYLDNIYDQSFYAFDPSIIPALDGSNFNSLENSSCSPCRNNIKLTIKPDTFPKPDNLTISNISHHTATATWSAPFSPFAVTGYVYQYKKSGEEVWSSEVQTSATTISLSGLEDGTDYDFRIKALYDSGASVYAVAHFTTIAHQTPADIAVSGITEESATLTWNAPASESPSCYVYQYKKTSDANWSSETQTAQTTVSLSGLTANTDYDFRVRARYGSYYSNYVTTQFVTAMPLPYDCGFEDGMDRWGVWDINWRYTGIRQDTAHDGQFCFRFNDTGGGGPQYLISPRFAVDNGIVVSFYHRPLSRVHAETFRVGHSTTTNDVNAFIWGDEVTSDEDNWEKYEQTCPSGTRYIAIKYTSDVFYLYLDDFHFEEYSAYAKPTGLTASSLTNQSATLTWTAPGNASPSGYAYQFKKLTDTSWSNEATVNGTSVTLSNLSANTTYDFRVKAVYNGNNASNYVTLRFITEGSSIDLPYNESFENGMGGWRVVDGRFDTGIYSDFPRTGSNGFIFQQAGAPQYLISPLINGGKEMVVSFHYKNYSEIEGEYIHSYTAGFKVGYSSTTKDPDAFTWSDKIESYYQWCQHTATIPEGTKYVSIQWVDGYFLYVDDISISAMQVQLTAQKASFNGQQKYLTTFYNKATSYQLQEGAEAYTVNRDGSELVFLRIGNGDSRVIPAGTPVVIVADKETSDTADTKEITVTALTSCDVSARSGNILQASDTDTAVTSGKIGNQTVYVLGIKNGAAGFYKFTGNSIPAGKAYYLK